MSKLSEQMLAARRHWVEVEPGKRLRFARPRAAQLRPFVDALSKGATGDNPIAVCSIIDGWEGFAEADLIGAAVGSSDALPFDLDACIEYVLDRPDVFGALVTAVVDELNRANEQRSDDRKN